MEKEQLYRLIEEKTLRLPYYIEKYVDYKRSDNRAKPNTLLSYLYDYERFFDWLLSEGYHPGPAKEVPLSILEGLKRDDITNFQNFLMRYTNMEKRTIQFLALDRIHHLLGFYLQIV